MMRATPLLIGIVFVPSTALTQAESERNHVPPAPPQHPMRAMSNQEMIDLMQMDDTSAFSRVLVDQLEWRNADGRDAASWDGQAQRDGRRRYITADELQRYITSRA